MEHAKPPRYRRLSPIGFWCSWSCVVFDLVLGFWLWQRPLMIIDAPFHWKYFWAVIFVTLAVYLMVTLIINNMRGTRYAMILNVIVKAYWAWTLIVLANKTGIVNGLSILDLWFFVAAVQAIIAIFTPPRIDYGLFAQ